MTRDSWHTAYGSLAYAQPSVMTQQAPPQPAAQQHAPPPQPQGPTRGHPIPSPSPVTASSAGVILQMQDSAKVPPPSVPNVAAVPFKPRERKVALLQDPNTMKVVELGGSKAADASNSSTPSASSQRSTPSTEPAKSEAPAAAVAATTPEAAKSLPNVSCSLVASLSHLSLLSFLR